MFKTLRMMVFLRATCLLITFNSVASVSYEILKLENCVTSNEDVIHVNFCAATSKKFNISADIKKPLSKMFVS